jgi:hypothetical protein
MLACAGRNRQVAILPPASMGIQKRVTDEGGPHRCWHAFQQIELHAPGNRNDCPNRRHYNPETGSRPAIAAQIPLCRAKPRLPWLHEGASRLWPESPSPWWNGSWQFQAGAEVQWEPAHSLLECGTQELVVEGEGAQKPCVEAIERVVAAVITVLQPIG